jgi:hypothetical protein
MLGQYGSNPITAHSRHIPSEENASETEATIGKEIQNMIGVQRHRQRGWGRLHTVFGHLSAI